MNKHRTHQIDDLAQRVFHNALPPTWVSNEHTNDYGKDFHVEIGDRSGDLTGNSFYVQLKGQERVVSTSDGHSVKYSLETKYAIYYLDKIKDLPVFLVLVDVEKKQGWWLFLQGALDSEKNWRNRGSRTLKIPKTQTISDVSILGQAVDEAKQWLRMQHSESIQAAVAFQKQRITRIDPRFDVRVSLVDDIPSYELRAKQPVSLKLQFAGEPNEVRRKLNEVIDKGGTVVFQPGEVKVEGSELFERFEELGCSIEANMKLPGAITLTSCDSEGKELARLSDVPGLFSGGKKEQWFDARLDNSPLALRLGPIALGVKGSIHFDLSLHRWEGQQLMHLAYFERLRPFFQSLPNLARTTVECHHEGNTVFSVAVNMNGQTFAEPFSQCLETIRMARKIAERFSVNPVWTVRACDQQMVRNIEQLYSIFFLDGWAKQSRNVRFSARFQREGFSFDLFEKADNPGAIRLVSDYEYPFFDKVLDVGKLVTDYSSMSARLVEESAKRRSRGKKGNMKERNRNRTHDNLVTVEWVGSESTVVTIRPE
jgi:hypothetical protein